MDTNTRHATQTAIGRQTLTSLLRELRTPETPDVCMHYGIAWRSLAPASDGRLHAVCDCGTCVTRSAFAS